MRLWITIAVLAAAIGCADDAPSTERGFFSPAHFGTYVPGGAATGGSSEGPCPTEPPCVEDCTIDLAMRASNCWIDTNRAFTQGVVEMTRGDEIFLRVEVDSPRGWVFHLGDSPSDNGGGGDGGDFSNDAEAYLMDNDLFVFGNDSSLGQPGHVREFPDIVPEDGPGLFWLAVGDGTLSVRTSDGDPPMCLNESSDDLLRLDANDLEGAPDRLWYLGMNQVYPGGRTGSGLRRVGVHRECPR